MLEPKSVHVMLLLSFAMPLRSPIRFFWGKMKLGILMDLTEMSKLSPVLGAKLM